MTIDGKFMHFSVHFGQFVSTKFAQFDCFRYVDLNLPFHALMSFFEYD